MERSVLMGVEDVSRVRSAMCEAANEMQRAMSLISSAIESLQRISKEVATMKEVCLVFSDRVDVIRESLDRNSQKGEGNGG